MISEGNGQALCAVDKTERRRIMLGSRTHYVERRLGVKLPQDYAAFIERHGIHSVNGVEVYGYDERVVDPEKIPCVIGATHLYGRDYRLEEGILVISHTGVEDIIVLLDTSTGSIFEAGADTRTKVASSFNEWIAELENR